MGTACEAEGTYVDQDLATPKLTVLAYCKSGVFDLKSKYFHFPDKQIAHSKSAPLDWKNCKVITVEKTKLIGRELDSSLVRDGDVEVTLRVLEPDSNGTTAFSKYWFLLSDFDGNWKIISYSIISDDAT